MIEYNVICGLPLDKLLESEPGTTGLYQPDSLKLFSEYLAKHEATVTVLYTILTDQALTDPYDSPYVLLRVMPSK